MQLFYTLHKIIITLSIRAGKKVLSGSRKGNWKQKKKIGDKNISKLPKIIFIFEKKNRKRGYKKMNSNMIYTIYI